MSTSLKKAVADLLPLVERCRQQRDALRAVGSNAREVGEIIAAKAACDKAMREVANLRAVAAAKTTAKLAFDVAPLLAAEAALEAAQARQDSIQAEITDSRGAQEILREELSTAHERLGEAVRVATADIRAEALQSYSIAVASLKDAVTVLNGLDGGTPIVFDIPALVRDGPTFATLPPSVDALKIVEAFSPAVREQRSALMALLR